MPGCSARKPSSAKAVSDSRSVDSNDQLILISSGQYRDDEKALESLDRIKKCLEASERELNREFTKEGSPFRDM